MRYECPRAIELDEPLCDDQPVELLTGKSYRVGLLRSLPVHCTTVPCTASQAIVVAVRLRVNIYGETPKQEFDKFLRWLSKRVLDEVAPEIRTTGLGFLDGGQRWWVRPVWKACQGV